MKTLTPESILKDVFGYDQFKPLQREVIANVLQRRDTLAIMPTGGGKSLCYQIPALIFPGLTVVVSPLIALMKDQVEQLRELGVPALFLNSSLTPDEYRDHMAQVRSGKIKLLYLAPEGLLTPRMFDLLSSVTLNCLTIDEAHCISEWGHDFRPEYRQLISVRERFKDVVCLALTATATPRVREDIASSLGFDASNEFIASFNRENLLIEVVAKADPLRQTLAFLEGFPNQSGIIYCFSRKQVDDLTLALAARKISVLPYHAGLGDGERKRNQERFIRDDVQVMVATIAFGMGINKPNVRFIVHYDLPKSIESYYQEIGRAGRDGLPAQCLLLFSYGDIQKLKYFIDQKDGLERQVAYQHLVALTHYAESSLCRRVPLLAYFGEEYPASGCGMCDRCLTATQEAQDVTIPAQKFLSCVKRTGERFGMAHIIDVLLGSQNQKVLRYNHHTVSTYGIGKDLPRETWQILGQRLVEQKLLAQDAEYGSLSLTPHAYEVLKTRQPIFATIQERDERAYAGRGTSAGEPPHDRNLFEILRSLRKELADRANVPPYVIFSDRSLIEMATYFPMTRESMSKIYGVGAAKLGHYGDTFIEPIRAYCAHCGLAERVKPGTKNIKKGSATVETPAARTPRHVMVGESYNQGKTLAQLAESYGVHASTILDHLTNYALEGHSLRAGNDLRELSTLSFEQQEAVLTAFDAEGADRLRPVFDRLDGQISYDELKIMRVVYLTQVY